jgi:hypothetical protein
MRSARIFLPMPRKASQDRFTDNLNRALRVVLPCVGYGESTREPYALGFENGQSVCFHMFN